MIRKDFIMKDFEDLIKYLFVTDQLDEVFWGKDKSSEKEDELVLRRIKDKKETNEEKDR